MDLLEIDGEKIIPTARALKIKPFYGIWKRDKFKDKRKALAELAFIEYYSSYSSEYNKLGLEEEEKIEAIKDDLVGLPNNWKPDELVMAATEKYEDMTLTQSDLLLADARIGVNKIRKYFKEVDLLEKDENGKRVNDPKALSAMLKQVREINSQLQKAQEDARKEREEEGKIYGGGQEEIYEDAGTMEKIITNNE